MVGGCFEKEFSEASIALFEEFKQGLKMCVFPHISQNELMDAPKYVGEVLDNLPENAKEFIIKTDEVIELAEKYIAENAVSKKWLDDATNIALAKVYKIDVLVSWNFKHIVNLNKIRIFNAVNIKNGYHALEIRTPKEILSL